MIDERLHAAIESDDPAALPSLLRAEPSLRDQYIDLLILDGHLTFEIGSAPVTVARSERTAPAGRTNPLRIPPIALSLAAALLITAAAVAVYVFAFSNPQSEIRNPKSTAPIATLIQSTGTVFIDDDFANPGSEYAAGTYSIESGSAQFILSNKITVDLRGATRLVMHSPLSASLEAGSASFNCPPGAEGFTVHLPDGSSIVDLGTAFRVDLNDDGAATIRVTEGSVEWVSAGKNAPRQVLNSGWKAVVVHNSLRVDSTDLLIADMVAGGDGLEPLDDADVRWIDLTSGAATAERYTSPTGFQSDGPAYHLATNHAMIDGVFVPDADADGVVIDSTGRRYDRFPDTRGMAFGHLGPGVESERTEERIADLNLSKAVNAWVGMHTSKAFTIDLDAVRRKYPHLTLDRFSARLINLSDYADADFRVLLDGEDAWGPRVLKPIDSFLEISVPLAPTARFLTIVSCDGPSRSGAWVAMGDPVLKTTPTSEFPTPHSQTTHPPTPEKDP